MWVAGAGGIGGGGGGGGWEGVPLWPGHSVVRVGGAVPSAALPSQWWTRGDKRELTAPLNRLALWRRRRWAAASGLVAVRRRLSVAPPSPSAFVRQQPREGKQPWLDWCVSVVTGAEFWWAGQRYILKSELLIKNSKQKKPSKMGLGSVVLRPLQLSESPFFFFFLSFFHYNGWDSITVLKILKLFFLKFKKSEVALRLHFHLKLDLCILGVRFPNCNSGNSESFPAIGVTYI